MRRVATLVAIPAAVVTLLLAVSMMFGPGASAAPPASDGPLRLDLTDMSPRVVTASGPGTLTVTGTLTNTGTTAVDQVVVRIQRGGPLDTEGEVRDALDGSTGTDAVTPQFVPLTDELAPGQQVPVSLSVPLRGPPQTSLALSGTGVQELLVNVNGAPRGADRARLAAVRLLLPVQSLLSGTPTTPAGSAAPFSMIYPIADTPRRLSTVPGGRAVLTDDRLAGSFAAGGRLNGLVAALGQAGTRIRSATCLAVDPDLLETAQAMQAGYDVLRPDGSAVPGTGGAAAGQWLAQLTAVARGGCVIALPFADADLVALTRGGEAGLAAAAIRNGRQVVAATLGTAVMADVTWPAGGVVDDPTLATIGGTGGRTLLLSADGVAAGRSRPSTGVVPVAGSSQVAVLTDPLLAQAAGGPTGSTPHEPGPGAAAVTSSPVGTDTPLSTQDVIGALAFRAQQRSPSAAGPIVLAPPHRWAADGTGARALLDAADQLIAAGALTPTPLSTVVSSGAAPGTPDRAAVYPLASGAQEIPGSVVTTIGSTAVSVADLRSAVVPGSSVGISADEVFAPLLSGLVRPASATLRGDPPAATAAATAGAARIDGIRSTVHVLEPPSPYSLGTSDAPLPLTLANGLPLTVQVRIRITSTAGLRVAPVAPVQIPPLGRRQVSVNAQVTRAGQFTVDAAVLTPNGGVLGPPSRLKVRSTVYGTITVWLTVGAGVLLVVLVARRMIRRIRGGGGPTPRADARTDPTTTPPTAPTAPAGSIPTAPTAGGADGRPSPRPPDPEHRPARRVPDRNGPDPRAPDPNGPDRSRLDRNGPDPRGPDRRGPDRSPGPAGTSGIPVGGNPAVPAPEDLAATDRFPARPPSPPAPPRTPTPRS